MRRMPRSAMQPLDAGRGQWRKGYAGHAALSPGVVWIGHTVRERVIVVEKLARLSITPTTLERGVYGNEWQSVVSELDAIGYDVSVGSMVERRDVRSAIPLDVSTAA